MREYGRTRQRDRQRASAGGKRGRGTLMARWITPTKRLAMYLRDGFVCGYCGTDLRREPRANVGLDHLLPRKRAGGNEASNLITSCGHCNSSKGTRDYTEFAPGGSLIRIAACLAIPLNTDLAAAIMEDYTPEWENWEVAAASAADGGEY